MVWKQASAEVLRGLRGTRSQRMFSRRLGYLGNPVRDWEAGRRFPTAVEALRAAQLTGVDVRDAFHSFHNKSAEHVSDIDDESLANWLRALRGTTKISELSQWSGQSRYSIGRWLSGDSRPRLPDFLQLVDTMTGRASDFVAELVDVDQVPALATLHRERTAAKQLAFEEPWTEAIMRLLETREYLALQAHDVGWLAERLGIDVDIAQRCIERMLNSGVIRFDGERIRPSKPLTIYTGGDKAKVRGLKSHWARVAVDRVELGEPSDWFAYNVMSISQGDLETVRQMLKNTYQEIRSIVAASTPEETVALVQLSLVDWDVAAKRGPVSGDGPT